MKDNGKILTKPEKLAEILYEAIVRYVNSQNGNKSLDFQTLKSGNGHNFRDIGKEIHDEEVR